MTQTDKLLSPYKIAGTTIKNRFIMAPMLMHDYFDDKGEITDDGIAFYEERAQGGFGLIYTGAFVALNEADNFNPGGIAPLRNPQAFIHGARDLTDRCHLYGKENFRRSNLRPRPQQRRKDTFSGRNARHSRENYPCLHNGRDQRKNKSDDRHGSRPETGRLRRC